MRSRGGALLLALAAFGGVLPLSCAEASTQDSASKIVAKRRDGRVDFVRGAEVLASYRYAGVSRPVLWPVRVPGGEELTRRWPMADAADGEKKDHPHHRSVWFAHGSVNGHDFWSEAKRAGTIVQVDLRGAGTASTTAGAGKSASEAFVMTRNEWRAKDGTRVCTDERVIRVVERGELRFVDFDIKLIASDGELVLGDTKEGTMALRLRPTLRQSGPVATGAYLSSAGLRDAKVWGTRAKWVHVQGRTKFVAAKETENAAVAEVPTIGTGLFDHPENPRHPTWWHARPYGLIAANPFGIHDFTKRSDEPRPKGAGDLKVEAGKSLRFRYRLLLHRGQLSKDVLEAEYSKWVAEKPSFEMRDR